jgi:hypothetical protein
VGWPDVSALASGVYIEDMPVTLADIEAHILYNASDAFELHLLPQGLQAAIRETKPFKL